MSETFRPEAAERVHFATDDRIGPLAEAYYRLRTERSAAHWRSMPLDDQRLLRSEARDWIRAAVAAGILPLAEKAQPPTTFIADVHNAETIAYVLGLVRSLHTSEEARVTIYSHQPYATALEQVARERASRLEQLVIAIRCGLFNRLDADEAWAKYLAGMSGSPDPAPPLSDTPLATAFGAVPAPRDGEQADGGEEL